MTIQFSRTVYTRIMRAGIAMLSTVLLTQCSSVEQSSSVPPATAPDNGNKVLTDTVKSERSAAQWLADAHEADSTAQQQTLLIHAALAFQNDEQWQQSAAILSQIRPRQLTPSAYPLFRLAQAQWLAQQHQWQQVSTTLEPIAQRFQQRRLRLQALNLLALSYAQQNQYWQAVVRQIEAEQYHGEATAQQSRDAIWRYLRQVPAAQLPQQRPSNSTIGGWWRLAKLFHDSQQQSIDLAEGFARWQSSYPDHLANGLVTEWQQQSWQTPQQVIALLPLSGRYQAQGIAVRDGLLMAAAAQQQDITFIDTNRTDIEQQAAQIVESGVTHVIGPLLKDNVEAWLKRPLPGVFHLMLNESDSVLSTVPTNTIIQFALAPEDEAHQAAEYLASQSQQAPLIFAANSGSSRRMVENFQQRLQQVSDHSATVGWYAEQEQMQPVVEELLGISASKQRIREVKIAAGKIIVDEQERSRADVDSVYLPGNLAQVRLLKPFIDVNLSPFAPPLTVYASSSVHERSNRGGDSDLSGVQFSDSPFLIGAHQQSSALEQWLELRSDMSFNEARLLAMGHDSLYLVSKAQALNVFPGAQWSGFNGRLSIAFNRVQRELDWAIFKEQAIQPLK